MYRTFQQYLAKFRLPDFLVTKAVIASEMEYMLRKFNTLDKRVTLISRPWITPMSTALD